MSRGRVAKRRLFPKTTRRRRYRRATGRAPLVKTIKRTILSMAEAKNKTLPFGALLGGPVEIYHNNGSPASGRILHRQFELNKDSLHSVQGDADNQRNGDHIYTQGISVHILFGQKYDRPNITWRVTIYSTASAAQAPTTVDELFEGHSGNILLDAVDKDKVRIIKDFYMKPGVPQFIQTTGGTTLAREYTFARKVFIPYKHKISFDTTGIPQTGRRIYMEVSAYDAYGSLITDNIGYFQAWHRLYYRDP